jgi:hypothetical protein
VAFIIISSEVVVAAVAGGGWLAYFHSCMHLLLSFLIRKPLVDESNNPLIR